MIHLPFIQLSSFNCSFLKFLLGPRETRLEPNANEPNLLFSLIISIRFLPMWRGNYSILRNNPPVLSVIIVELNPIDGSLLLSYFTYYKSFAIFKLPALCFVSPPPARAPLEFCKGFVLNHSWDECNLIISSTSWRQQLCKIWRQPKFNSYGQHENDECRKTFTGEKRLIARRATTWHCQIQNGGYTSIVCLFQWKEDLLRLHMSCKCIYGYF